MAMSFTNLSKFVRVDTSPARIARVWVSVAERLGSEPRSVRSWRRPLLVMAVMTMLIVGAGLFLRKPPATQTAWNGTALETGADGLTVELKDGSRLALAAKTRTLMLSDSPKATALRIAHGRLTCDLAKRPERNFSVFAGNVEVRVTGTRFTVELDPTGDRVEVAVERGSVLVVTAEGDASSRSLHAGERWSSSRQAQARDAVRATASAVTGDEAASNSASSAAGSAPSGSDANEAASPEAPLADASAPSAARGMARTPMLAEKPAEEPPDAKTLFEQGNAARRLGDPAGAAAAYQTLLTRFPTDSHVGLAAFELGRLRVGPLHDPRGAVAALKLASAAVPGGSLREDIMARLVEAYAGSGDVAACRAARAAYRLDYPQGLHAALVSRFCGNR